MADAIDRIRAPRPPDQAAMRTDYFEWIERISLGAISTRENSFSAGPLTLLRFGPALPDGHGWSWPILGGLLARCGGGTLSFRWEKGELAGRVDGYHPMLPAFLYRWFQLRFHHFLTRRYLLRLRGRVPVAGVPVGAAPRLAAAAFDLALCAALTVVVARRAPLRGFAATAVGYHLLFWSRGGRTPGARLAGQRLAAVDGSNPSFGQALLRLLALPAAAIRLGAAHDELAGTEVLYAPRRSVREDQLSHGRPRGEETVRLGGIA